MSRIITTSFVQPLVLSVLLTMSLSACTTASKTASDAPSSTASNGTTPTSTSANDNKGDAQSDVRKKQIESDIRAREQRNAIGGDPQKRDPEDLASEVRGKLEANIPSSKLTVTAKDAEVTVSGTVASQDQLAKIKPLALQIKGVKTAIVKAVVKP
ncbi:BON domain-containing protein [Chamaesiphon minutus]|uniref:Putative periplasmic or secreted lipoprotein n=1 Tax=Chamaesiphon minutus (strain ATCC 27169 / PCC 6605) TaxID=1173020 RepID=K9UG51_CHAP6|nr:BON domain-containing protein [Chamaesiphon minutus]AFY93765.1 putative periplasmic or secreted lipoprotein [Chamaesiphon minutus PCC 6605]